MSFFFFIDNTIIIWIRLFLSPKSGLQQSPLLAANDDDESTIMPLTRFEYGKHQYHDVTETQKL